MEITVKLPEPIYNCIVQKAKAADLSPEAWLVWELSQSLGIALGTPEESEQRVCELLQAEVGYMLCPGTPTFDVETGQWRMPVLPNLCNGKVGSVGEMLIDAATGKVLTDGYAVNKMAEEAGAQLGIEKLPDDIQERTDELLDEQNRRSLTDEEQRELDDLLAFWNAHNLANARRLAASIQSRCLHNFE